jgi:hypothetical protein
MGEWKLMELTGQFFVRPGHFTPGGRTHGMHCVGGLLVPITGLDTLAIHGSVTEVPLSPSLT